MDNLTLNVLQYGVLGLCAIMLIATWRIISAEQKRAGQPRSSILKFSSLFMAFCVILAIVNGYVQLTEGLKSRLAEQKIQQIRAATAPLLDTHVSFIEALPDELWQKKQLLFVQRQLREALDDDSK